MLNYYLIILLVLFIKYACLFKEIVNIFILNLKNKSYLYHL